MHSEKQFFNFNWPLSDRARCKYMWSTRMRELHYISNSYYYVTRFNTTNRKFRSKLFVGANKISITTQKFLQVCFHYLNSVLMKSWSIWIQVTGFWSYMTYYFLRRHFNLIIFLRQQSRIFIAESWKYQRDLFLIDKLVRKIWN